MVWFVIFACRLCFYHAPLSFEQCVSRALRYMRFAWDGRRVHVHVLLVKYRRMCSMCLSQHVVVSFRALVLRFGDVLFGFRSVVTSFVKAPPSIVDFVPSSGASPIWVPPKVPVRGTSRCITTSCSAFSSCPLTAKVSKDTSQCKASHGHSNDVLFHCPYSEYFRHRRHRYHYGAVGSLTDRSALLAVGNRRG